MNVQLFERLPYEIFSQFFIKLKMNHVPTCMVNYFEYLIIFIVFYLCDRLN